MIVITSITEMPEKCFDCPLSNKEYDYCQADIGASRKVGEWRPFWCPLKEVKED